MAAKSSQVEPGYQVASQAVGLRYAAAVFAKGQRQPLELRGATTGGRLDIGRLAGWLDSAHALRATLRRSRHVAARGGQRKRERERKRKYFAHKACQSAPGLVHFREYYHLFFINSSKQTHLRAQSSPNRMLSIFQTTGQTSPSIMVSNICWARQKVSSNLNNCCCRCRS